MSLDITELAISVRDLQVRLGGVQVLHGLALDLPAEIGRAHV